MIKTSNAALLTFIAFIAGFILGVIAFHKYQAPPVEVRSRDTVIIRDTIRGDIPPPEKIQVIRIDTVRLEISPDNAYAILTDTVEGDTADTQVLVPITSKIYRTEDYRAVVSGWRPSLDSMEVYSKTTTISNTVTKYKSPHWALTLGGGVGYTTDKKIVPFVGVSVGYVLWSR